MNRTVSLKSVNDILGMNFFIPDYQRGYRWERQQAIDLLEDIFSFASKAIESEEIYCIQPLVVSERQEDILAKCKRPESTLDDIKKFIKGSWTVVDGQQRLTTIYLILSCLGISNRYEIDYRTREGSSSFLKDIQLKTQAEAGINIDFYHMFIVYSTINEWLDKKTLQEKEMIKNALLNQVHFIWYQVDAVDEIAVFTRLNIGKIPLTDAELIKALFLNRANFSVLNVPDKQTLEITQQKIAVEWDQIEHTLQNDEFWFFIHGAEYCKPTRIDYILDSICEKDGYKLFKSPREFRNTKKNNNRDEAKAFNKALQDRIGNDEHRTFRYFNEAFSVNKNNTTTNWLDKLWKEVRKYYHIFNEWYQDYQLYHYIGYLSSVSSSTFDVTKHVSEWTQKTKEEFAQYLKDEIVQHLVKKTWIKDLINYKFDQDGNKSKRECVDVLLLHNIETIIQQNEKLVLETKYNLPNFTKFPFHLYKKESWQVEHIRPNAGDDLKKEEVRKLYLSLAQQYVKNDSNLSKKISDYLTDAQDGNDFVDIVAELSQIGGSLPDEDKNKIWNYVLLDETTNKEYGNQIFPVKRAFIVNKENGKKTKYSFENGRLIEKETVPEVAFVPPCTKNVFSKLYTTMPKTMINWNKEDAEAYWNDIADKLDYYIKAIG